MASRPGVAEVFECAGSFSFLQEPHRFTFRIHSDNSLRVDVKPVASPSVPVETSVLAQETDTRGTIEDIDDVEEGEDQDVQEDGLPAEEDAEEASEAKLLAFDGRALVEAPLEAEQHTTQSVWYVVHFKVVRWGRGEQGMWSHIVKCIAHLSKEHGVSGRFVDVQDNLDDAQDFTLRPVGYRMEPCYNPLHPLTPGQYELQGITIAENAFVYECVVHLTLQANGMMSGSSRELPFTQECPLAGMWTRSGLNYLLQYEMHGNKHTYIYFGTPFRSGLQGTWHNAALRVLEGNLDAQTSRAERGVLEFQLVRAVRVWSEAYHKDYPAVFRECVKLLLLASHRDCILPSHVWSSIIAYCGYDWFQTELQKALARSETKDSDSEAAEVP